MVPPDQGTQPPDPEFVSVAKAVYQLKNYAVFRMDLAGRAATWNLGVREVLGFERDEFLGRDLLPLIWTPEDVADGAAQRELEEAARVGYASDDRWMVRKNRERFWAIGTTAAFHDDDGTLLGYLKILRDLTPHRIEHDNLVTRTQELERANADLHDLVHLVAHDFKEPLRGILYHLGVLDEGAPPAPEVQQGRSAVRALVERLRHMVDAMLDTAQVAAGEIRCERVSLGAIAMEAARQVEGLREAKAGIVRLAPGMPDVDGDPALLTQALANLIGNALKYNEAPNPEVEVTAAEELGRVVIRVKDNGIGIAEKDRESIFGMFKRLHGRERYGGGTGMGLPLVRKIVERHGGRIWVDPPAGTGSTFVISLPRIAGPLRPR